VSERRASLENDNVEADPPGARGRPPRFPGQVPSPERQGARTIRLGPFHRGSGDSMFAQDTNATRETPAVAARDRQRESREGQTRPCGVTERFVVAKKPGNSGQAKEPQFKDNATSGADGGDWR
jgi:hypothetical protein